MPYSTTKVYTASPGVIVIKANVLNKHSKSKKQSQTKHTSDMHNIVLLIAPNKENAIKSGNDTQVDNYLGKLYGLSGKNEFSTSKAVRDPKTGEPIEYLVYLKDSDGLELPEPISLKPNDKNLFYKVANTYQRVGGNSKNVELEAIGTPSPKPAPKKEPTEAQFAAAARLSGMTIEEYKKAYKASQKKQ
jgi:hypothetical protein